MENKWKEIWEKRTDRFDEIDMTDPKAVFLELKRIDGFDVVEGGMSYDALLKQNNDSLKKNLIESEIKIKSQEEKISELEKDLRDMNKRNQNYIEKLTEKN